MLDWNDLRFALSIHRHGSLLAAARALAVDKATVSRRIAALEQALGAQLFERRPSGYTLTPHGQRVLSVALDVDLAIEGMSAELSGAQGEASGVVHVTVPEWFAHEALVPALPAFRALHPGIELVLSASSRMLNLAQREAEVALRNRRPEQKSLSARKAGTLRSAMFGARHYLERRGAPGRREDLARHDLIAYEHALTFVPGFAWLNDHAARVVLRTGDALGIARALEAGLGLAVIPTWLAARMAHLKQVDAFGSAEETIHAVFPTELRRAARVRAVVELLLEAFGQVVRG